MATTLAPTMNEVSTGLRHWLSLTRWNMARALIVTRREVSDMYRDWRIIVPSVVLTLVFPSIANWGAGRMLAFTAQYGAELVAERLIPFLLMVVGFFPISFSLIIALESFVGEKERHSLEPLLATPLTNLQLYIGKTLSATLPPVVGSMLGVTVYLAGIYANVDWLPPAELVVQIVLLNLVQALVMVSAAVVVSSQVTSVRAANLLASFIIIPMSFLIQAEAMIMFWANYGVLWLILLGLLLVNILLVRMGVQIFNREELLGRDIDELNLIGGLKKWFNLTLARRSASGTPRRPWKWYREEVLAVVGRMWPAVAVVAIAMGAAFYVGMQYAEVYQIPANLFRVDDWLERFQFALEASGFTGLQGVALIAWQNIRVLAVASGLAVFSFGVLAVMLLMVPLGLAGFLSATMLTAGIDPLTVWAALIPHSLLEIPAAILAGAAALRLGAVVISPPPGKTVGQAWTEALADATRLWFTLILPMLILAAFVEIFVTPGLIRLVVGAF